MYIMKTTCKKQTNKKYTMRKSPPYSANDCKDKALLGNDGSVWVSIANSKNIYQWKKKI